MPDTLPPYTITDTGCVILNTNTSSGTITLNGDAENTYTITTNDNDWMFKDYLRDNEIKDLKILLEILHSLPEDNPIKQQFNAQKALNTLRGEDEN